MLARQLATSAGLFRVIKDHRPSARPFKFVTYGLELVRLKELEEENRRLRHIVADQALDIQMLKHVAEGN